MKQIHSWKAKIWLKKDTEGCYKLFLLSTGRLPREELDCDTAGDKGIFYSMCKIVTWVEDVEKWQLLEINKLCLKLACILSSVVPTCPTAKL